MLNPIYFLMYCTGEKINITQIEGNFPQAPFPKREDREAFVKDWIQVPDEKFKQYFLDWDPRGENSIPYYPNIEATCEILVSSATGIDMDEAGLSKAAKRNRTLVRAVNIRRGMRRKDEKPPEDHWKKRFPELEAELLDEYYKFKGFNKQGIPTKESCQDLSLDYVSEDFLQRGILTDDEGTPSKEASAAKK
jgi:hypothetical protein